MFPTRFTLIFSLTITEQCKHTVILSRNTKNYVIAVKNLKCIFNMLVDFIVDLCRELGPSSASQPRFCVTYFVEAKVSQLVVKQLIRTSPNMCTV